jgi:hypothetical protein
MDGPVDDQAARLEWARAEAERRLNEHVDALIADAERKLGRKQRRQELKLVRQGTRSEGQGGGASP